MIPEWHVLGYEMTNYLYLYIYIMISLHIYQYHDISCGIMWYQACEARRPQRERFSDAERHFSPCDAREEAYVCFIVRAVNLLVQVVEYFCRPFAFHPFRPLLRRQGLGHEPYIAKGKPPLLVRGPFLDPAVRDCKDVSANANLAAALALTYEVEWIRFAADH